MTSRRPGWFVAATVLGLAFALAFLFLPIVGILADVPPAGSAGARWWRRCWSSRSC